MNKAYMPFSFLIFVPCLARWNDSLEFAVKASIRKKKRENPQNPVPAHLVVNQEQVKEGLQVSEHLLTTKRLPNHPG